jgi:hypothetical protein
VAVLSGCVHRMDRAMRLTPEVREIIRTTTSGKILSADRFLATLAIVAKASCNAS